MSKKKKKKPGRTTGELHPRVMISGYYGFENLGDELILRVLVDELKAQNIKITVLSNDPQRTAQAYGVDAVQRMNLIDIIDALAQCNLFISGGGGLFQDATGRMSVLYYGGLIRLARFFEVPVCFWAQGVGPLNREFSRKFTAKAIRQCESVIVRDDKSADLVASIAGERPEVTADPVWLLNLPQNTKRRESDDSSPWRVGVSLRPWPELTPDAMRALAHCLRELAADQPTEFVLLPLQKKEDTHLLEEFRALLEAPAAGRPGSSNTMSGTGMSSSASSEIASATSVATSVATAPIVTMASPEDVVSRIGECDVLFGMRFHSLILALLYGIPVYGLVYDPKVAALLERFDLQGTAIDALHGINVAEIRNYFDTYPEIDLKPLKKQSRRNFQILNRLLEIPDAELVL